jgi:hypothetical protein
MCITFSAIPILSGMFLIAINGLAKDKRSRIIARMKKYRKPFLV